MRSSMVILTSLFVLVTPITYGNEDEYLELEKIANEIRVAVIKEDVDALLKYVSPLRTTFIDNAYTYSEIKELLKNKESWLYNHLFAGKHSVKNYFKNAKDLELKIYRRNNNAIFISYRSSNYDAINWVECCFIRDNGKWYFDGIFSCE